MNLQPLKEGIYYLPGAVNAGVIAVGSGEAVLVDTGLDESAGKKILRALAAEGLRLVTIITTHAHADHFGANAFLAARTGARVYAPPLEAAIIGNPLLEPLYLFGGASPLDELKNKFLLAPASPLSGLLTAGPFTLAGLELEAVSLPGHSPAMMGIACRGVLFCADAYFSEAVLDKHRLPYFYDVGQALESLQFLHGTTYEVYFPGHGEPCTDPRPVVAANESCIREISRQTVALLRQPLGETELLEGVLDHLGVTVRDAGLYFLDLAALRAHLGFLRQQGQVQLEWQGNRLLWVAS